MMYRRMVLIVKHGGNTSFTFAAVGSASAKRKTSSDNLYYPLFDC